MINILLSTYDASKFLSAQYDSLLAQTIRDTSIFVRDDGSTDNTVEILKDIASHNSCVKFVKGENIGVINSFFTLLKNCSDTEYYSFCDQDDVWFPDKIERAISSLTKIDSQTPALYFSRLEYVEANLNHIGYSDIPQYDIAFENALVENIATGCSIVMNKSARDLIISYLPEKCVMHDWWCLLVVTAFGEIIYDPKPGVKYRLHNNNVVGVPVSPVQDFNRRIKRFTRAYDPDAWVYAQAKEFQALYHNILPQEKTKTLQRFIDSRRSWVSRFKYAITPDVYRQRWLDNLILKLLIVFNRY